MPTALNNCSIYLTKCDSSSNLLKQYFVVLQPAHWFIFPKLLPDLKVELLLPASVVLWLRTFVPDSFWTRDLVLRAGKTSRNWPDTKNRVDDGISSLILSGQILVLNNNNVSSYVLLLSYLAKKYLIFPLRCTKDVIQAFCPFCPLPAKAPIQWLCRARRTLGLLNLESRIRRQQAISDAEAAKRLRKDFAIFA